MDPYQKMLGEVCAELDAERDHAQQREAQRFLAQLDPESTEGMWFDAMAGSFPSRLDAAIAYLEAMAAGP